LTLIETRKSRDIQFINDNDFKKINMRKIYHICKLFVILTIFRNEKSAYIVYFTHIYVFIHYQIVCLYFSVFQLVSTNCFSMEGSRLSALLIDVIWNYINKYYIKFILFGYLENKQFLLINNDNRAIKNYFKWYSQILLHIIYTTFKQQKNYINFKMK
jgi:hypothetical protein